VLAKSILERGDASRPVIVSDMLSNGILERTQPLGERIEILLAASCTKSCVRSLVIDTCNTGLGQRLRELFVQLAVHRKVDRRSVISENFVKTPHDKRVRCIDVAITNNRRRMQPTAASAMNDGTRGVYRISVRHGPGNNTVERIDAVDIVETYTRIVFVSRHQKISFAFE
jgi:hypothetical protein